MKIKKENDGFILTEENESFFRLEELDFHIENLKLEKKKIEEVIASLEGKKKLALTCK